MLIHPGHHLGDAWFHVDPDGLAHCFYLVCPDTVARHTAWDIAHATSRDLVEWELHGIVIERGTDGDWDGGCLATGSVLAVDGGYVLAYTARWNEPAVATGLATSPDLFTWTKHPANPATVPGPPYAVDRPWRDRPPTHWRDPFLTRDSQGRLRLLICAARPDRADDASGTIAVVTQLPSSRWRVDDPLDVEPVARELECPQIVELDGRWFLLFSCAPELFCAEVRSEPATLSAGTYAMVGPGPQGPFAFHQREPIVPQHHPVQPYAGQVLAFDRGHVLLGTVWQDDGPDYICNPIPVRAVGQRLVV